LAGQFVHIRPYVLAETDLPEDQNLSPGWHERALVERASAHPAVAISDRVCARNNPAGPDWKA
jgi:hypothetical protein